GPGRGVVHVGRLSRPRSGSVSAATDGRETLSEVLVDGHPKRKTARVLAVLENTPLESMRKHARTARLWRFACRGPTRRLRPRPCSRPTECPGCDPSRDREGAVACLPVVVAVAATVAAVAATVAAEADADAERGAVGIRVVAIVAGVAIVSGGAAVIG